MALNNDANGGHRQRVRERYIQAGNFDNFQDYEVLEMMLFYVYPRRDTKPIAKKLIMMYGSLSGVLNTEPERLMKEAGLTENVAVYLSMFPPVMRKHVDSFYRKGTVIDHFLPAYNALSQLLLAQKFESFYLMSLDINKKLISIDRMGDGNSTSVNITCDEVYKKAILNNASYVIIAHNHPGGTSEPSRSDMNLTEALNEGFSALGIRLMDHIIICGRQYFSFAKERYCGLTYKR